MAASPGFEPRLTESESAVLPLDDEAIIQKLFLFNAKKIASQQLLYKSQKNITPLTHSPLLIFYYLIPTPIFLLFIDNI